MPVVAEWDNEERTVIRYTFSPHWSTHDLEDAIRVGGMLMGSVEHTVHTICDLRGPKRPPANILRLLEPLEDNLPDNRGINVIVGAGYWTMAYYEVGRQLVPRLAGRQRFAGSLNSARKIIQRQRD